MSDLIHGVEVLEVDDGIRTIQTARSSVIGLIGTMPDADAAKLPLNTPVLVVGQRAALALVDSAVQDPDRGTIGESLSAIHAVCEPVIVVVRVTDPGVGNLAAALVGDAVARTGIYALLNAKAVLGVSPRILIAPNPDGYLYGGGAGEIDGAPAAAALVAVCNRIKAICVIDGPDTEATDANHAVQTIGSKRAYLVDPFVEYGGIIQPNSPFVAALISKIDAEVGFWKSPSNELIPGITGTARPIDYAAGDAACEADILNGFHAATIIRESGYRLWGNFTCDTLDPKWKFLTVVRIADMLNESILENHRWAVDQNITANYIDAVIGGVEDYMRRLTAKGAIYGGSCWLDPELNTPESIAAGDIYFDFDFTPVATANKITFRSHLVNSYIESII